MLEASELHVIIGASGGTRSVIVRELVARGKRVRGVNRSGYTNFPFDIEMIQAHATDSTRMREVCQGVTVGYNRVNPPFTRWRELFPAVMEAMIAGTAIANAKLAIADIQAML
ncbi:hypothetical protein H6F93_01860 [Leptolyngbya sp. FACHB-671]|uniref:hypothetical protein n=1 Tax=Leptolyngbya sp. FACHB-671 TaxID=2692812 RepID=UPI00168A253A|nr:hypothetical protein [Leptolyngbya sp. FACHB-671]MBD2066284.1 hypothetical protein [Leptolyngbya sp. FACHB-671]